MSKVIWSTTFLIIALCSGLLYHTGVKAEQDCLANGNSADECAKLVMQ